MIPWHACCWFGYKALRPAIVLELNKSAAECARVTSFPAWADKPLSCSGLALTSQVPQAQWGRSSKRETRSRPFYFLPPEPSTPMPAMQSMPRRPAVPCLSCLFPI
jgi:hypothetical protein